MRSRIIYIASLLLPLALAACGGGSGTKSGAAQRAQTLTGSRPAPATETTAAIAARSARIVSRADSLVFSNIYGTTDHADLPRFTIRARCAGTRCALRVPELDYSGMFSFDDLEFATDATTDFRLTKHGITLGRTRATDAEAYGAWMEHAGFAVQTETDKTRTDAGQDVNWRFRYGFTGGDLTGNRPTGNATWLGLMVGSPATGNPNVLQGDATLQYSLDAGTLDAAFTGIKDLTRNAAHSTDRVQFDDIPVAADGTYAGGLTGNRIQGGFYGPEHAEAAGVFEQSGIIGAFGAKKRQ